MKILMTVLKGEEIVRRSVLDDGNALVAATLELLEDNMVAMSKVPDNTNPDQFNFEMRGERTLN